MQGTRLGGEKGRVGELSLDPEEEIIHILRCTHCNGGLDDLVCPLVLKVAKWCEG